MKDRLKSLDTLKGIAIFAVVLFHLKDVFPGAFQDVLGIFYKWGGYFGNYLFFMLSGIYISWGYKQRIIDHELNFVEFMKRRLVKFYPVYFVTELICVYFIVKQTGMERLGIPEILRNLLCISCGWIDNSLPYNLPCWFLSQLLLIYILYFFILWLFKEKALCVFGGLIIWGEVLLKAGFDFPFSYVQDGEGFTNFFLGCLLFELMTKVKEKFRYVCELALGAALVCVFFFSAVGMLRIPDIRDVFIFLICPMVILMAVDLNPVRKLLESSILYRAFGRISVYVFFWHIPLFRIYSTCLGRYDWYRSGQPEGKLLFYMMFLYVFCVGLSVFFSGSISDNR